jgi:transcription initiation factor TFIID subunit 2
MAAAKQHSYGATPSTTKHSVSSKSSIATKPLAAPKLGTVAKPPSSNTTPIATKQPVVLGAKQHGSSATPSATKPTVSKEKIAKMAKNGEPRRDSISVLPAIRPTIEPPQPEQRPQAPKVNGNGNLLKPSKLLKRASTDSESSRPSKMVKLNTSGIRDAMKNLKSKPPKKVVQSKVITVKFTNWSQLNTGNESPDSVSIRAAGKKPMSEKKSTTKPGGLTVPSTPRATPGITTGAPKATNQTQPRPRSSTPTSTKPPVNPQSGDSSGKQRKPLPDMRKPLPSAASNPHPTPSKSSSSAGPPAPKAPQKVKIKVKSHS